MSISIPVALLQATSRVVILSDDYPEAQNIFRNSKYNKVVIQGGHIVATNGHMLFCSKLENVPEDFQVSIPMKNVESFLKKIENFDAYDFELSIDTNNSIVTMEKPSHCGAFEAFRCDKHINFIPWQSVIVPKPTEQILGYPHFQTQYLVALDKIANDLGDICCLKKIHPMGLDKSAYVEFMYSEYPAAFALIMPFDIEEIHEKGKYAVYIEDITGESEDGEAYPAESRNIAFKAVQRYKKDLSEKGLFRSRNNHIKVVGWIGSDQEHKEKMLYTEAWFDKPLRQYNDPQKAIEYMTEYDEVVKCYDTKSSIVTRSVDEVKSFFGLKEAEH